MFTTKPVFHSVNILLLLVVLAGVAFSAGGVDASFRPFVARTNSPPENVTTHAIQPDGKLLIGGNFTVVGNYPVKSLARLNPDGTVDTSFHSPDLDGDISLGQNDVNAGDVYAIALQPDGKIWISGVFRNVDGVPCETLARLNPDGTPDTVFNAELHRQLQFAGILHRLNVLPDGKVLLGGYFTLTTLNHGVIQRPISRINQDGSYDPTFSTSTVLMTCHDMDVLPDGRIMIAGGGGASFNYVGLARLHPTGAIDFSFSGVHLNVLPHPHAGFGNVLDFKVLPNGQILIGGSFGTVNGVARPNFARINPDGLLDTTFNQGGAGTNSTISRVDVTADGKILLGGNFNTYNGIGRNRLVRLNADATVDGSFNYTQPNKGIIKTTYSFPDGRLFIGGTTEYQTFALGETDWDKSSILTTTGAVMPQNHLIGAAGVTNSIVQQPDGKVLIGGRFETVDGKRRTNIARLNADGTLDEGFTPPPYPEVRRLAIQPDGKVLVASSVDSSPIRLNTDGTKDIGFSTPVTGVQRDIAVFPGGKVIIVGELTVPSLGSRRIVRLNANGSVDGTFNIPDIPDALVRRTLVQPDGKILLLGFLHSVAGVPAERLARLNANGTLDQTFVAVNPLGPFINAYLDMALQPDGKIVVAGGLAGGFPNGYAGRFNADGSIDTHFAQTSWTTSEVALQADGKILLGGNMTSVNGIGSSGIARLNADGTVDLSFETGAGSNDQVTALAIQTDGKILAGGEFNRFDRQSRVGLVRLKPDTARTNFDFDGDGKADISVFRPSTNRWYRLLSGNGSVVESTFGTAGDVRVPADYDGDGRTDEAVFHPSTGNWHYRGSVDPDFITEFHWGLAGDIPRPSDFDGDGKDDLVVFRPSNGVWYSFGSTGAISVVTFGIAGDKPVIGDFDGDGLSDHAVFRPSTGDWWYTRSSVPGDFGVFHWGVSTDVPTPADYDGDGRTDLAVYRPSEGRWYIRNSGNGSVVTTAFGLAEDRPVAADYDGDGKADIAVFRPSTGIWYIMRSTAGFSALQFGLGTDEALPGSFVW